MSTNNSQGEKTILFKPELRKIDVVNADAFSADILSRMELASRVVLDLSEVQFIDSSGLGKIVAALRALRERGGEMRICGVQPPVQVLFAMVRLGEIVGIDADSETAARRLEGRQEPGTAV